MFSSLHTFLYLCIYCIYNCPYASNLYSVWFVYVLYVLFYFLWWIVMHKTSQNSRQSPPLRKKQIPPVYQKQKNDRAMFWFLFVFSSACCCFIIIISLLRSFRFFPGPNASRCFGGIAHCMIAQESFERKTYIKYIIYVKGSEKKIRSYHLK